GSLTAPIRWRSATARTTTTAIGPLWRIGSPRSRPTAGPWFRPPTPAPISLSYWPPSNRDVMAAGPSNYAENRSSTLLDRAGSAAVLNAVATSRTGNSWVSTPSISQPGSARNANASGNSVSNRSDPVTVISRVTACQAGTAISVRGNCPTATRTPPDLV